MYQYFISFLLPNNTPLCKYTTFYLSIHQWWTFGLFLLFEYRDYFAMLYRFLCGHLFNSFGWVELLEHMMTLYNLLRNFQDCFPSGCAILYSQQQCVKFSVSLYSPQHLSLSVFLADNNILVGVKWYLIAVIVFYLLFFYWHFLFFHLLQACS